MCQMCLKHGAAGKWYLNAKNYMNEIYEDANSYEYLENLWGNLERSYVRKVYGLMNMSGLSKHANTPLIGKVLKWYANRGFLFDGTKKKINYAATQGHFGQVITINEAKTIVTEIAPIIAKAQCPCKYFTRGIKEATCLGFTPLVEVLNKLPRFVPKNGVEILNPDKAIAFLDEMSKKGRVNTIWCAPVPAIAALCSCDAPSCGALRLREFNINACWKGDYIADLDKDKCIQCGNCSNRCQFKALEYREGLGPEINLHLCFGCGKCTEVCEQHAIKLIDRNQIPETRGKY